MRAGALLRRVVCVCALLGVWGGVGTNPALVALLVLKSKSRTTPVFPALQVTSAQTRYKVAPAGGVAGSVRLQTMALKLLPFPPAPFRRHISVGTVAHAL